MNKKTFVIISSWLLVFVVMLMIFNFSSENAEQSTETSKDVVVQVLDVVMDKEEITPPVVQKYQVPIRKLAHFGIYMLLGFCMYNAFDKSFKLKFWLNMLLATVACIIYAISDEFHQNFSANRGPAITDVLIDSSGAVLGIILFFLFNLIYFKIFLVKFKKK